jgi:hypothetical protein
MNKVLPQHWRALNSGTRNNLEGFDSIRYLGGLQPRGNLLREPLCARHQKPALTQQRSEVPPFDVGYREVPDALDFSENNVPAC